ncbi:MAG: hypothetical protein JNM59_06665 [Hyphomonadaceae bacterium]|nr:hypothetical protein [Hyphomonadaceae bacterium]
MALSRRTLILGASAPLLLANPPVFLSDAAADTATYVYDPLGRLIRVHLSDGTVIVYDYDAAGNRIRQVRGNGNPFSQTLQITGTGPVNLRTIADQAGYTGITDATITFQLGSTVTISGAPGAPNGGIALDTGLWPSSQFAISLTLQVSGKIYGGGGAGGSGAGGDAIYCRNNITVVVNAGGQVKAGGGGGGGGGGWQLDTQGAEGEWTTSYLEGGGGGGGFPNGPGGTSAGPGGSGASGTSSGGGAGGAAGTQLQHTAGAGGAGGGAAATGAAGATGSGSPGCGSTRCWTGPFSGAPGGAPGYAIRKNGKTVTVTNNGTITGTQA